MKSIIFVAVALVAVAVAAPTEKQPVKVILYKFETEPDNSYFFKFENEDGTAREEKGSVKDVLDEENNLKKVIVVNGWYTFLNDQGKPETVNYVADEAGYRAEGDSIPKAERR